MASSWACWMRLRSIYFGRCIGNFTEFGTAYSIHKRQCARTTTTYSLLHHASVNITMDVYSENLVTYVDELCTIW